MPIEAREFGFQELYGRVARTRAELRNRALRSGVRAAGNVFKAEIQERAPVLDHKTAQSTALDPGELREDIHVSTHVDGGTVAESYTGPGERTEHVAYWVEYGHRLVKGGYSHIVKGGPHAGRFRGPGREVGEVAPHPFVRPAFEAGEAAAKDACDEVILGALAGGMR